MYVYCVMALVRVATIIIFANVCNDPSKGCNNYIITSTGTISGNSSIDHSKDYN